MRGRLALRPMDLLVPAGIAAVAAVEMLLARPDGWLSALVFELVAAAVLVARRLAPLVLPTVAGVVVLAIPWFGPALDHVATPILVLAAAIYTLGRWVSDLRGLAGLGVVLLVTLLDYLLVDERAHDATDVVFVATLAVPPYVFGRLVRRMADQKQRLELHQRAERERAIRDERDRIARDLHDVVAHSLSAMVVQTAAAQDLLRSHPDRAAALLKDVAATGRRALGETGHLLHVIRDEDDELGLRPVPGLAELPALVDEFRSRGLVVRAALPEQPPALPGGVDVSAYRIAQEVLTNALRYAPDRAADVRICADDGVLSIIASNACDGRTGQGSGLGLLGVAERVKVLGGSLRYGVDQGRFELEATMPTGGP